MVGELVVLTQFAAREVETAEAAVRGGLALGFVEFCPFRVDCHRQG